MGINIQKALPYSTPPDANTFNEFAAGCMFLFSSLPTGATIVMPSVIKASANLSTLLSL